MRAVSRPMSKPAGATPRDSGPRLGRDIRPFNIHPTRDQSASVNVDQRRQGFCGPGAGRSRLRQVAARANEVEGHRFESCQPDRRQKPLGLGESPGLAAFLYRGIDLAGDHERSDHWPRGVSLGRGKGCAGGPRRPAQRPCPRGATHSDGSAGVILGWQPKASSMFLRNDLHASRRACPAVGRGLNLAAIRR